MGTAEPDWDHSGPRETPFLLGSREKSGGLVHFQQGAESSEISFHSEKASLWNN